MSENLVDNGNYMCYTVNELDAKSNYSIKNSFDVVFIVDEVSYSDTQLEGICKEIQSISEKIFKNSDDVTISIYGLNGSGIIQSTWYGRTDNIDSITVMLNKIEHKTIDNIYDSVILSDCIDYVTAAHKASDVLAERQEYCFVFFNPEYRLADDKAAFVYRSKSLSRTDEYGIKMLETINRNGTKIDFSTVTDSYENIKAQSYSYTSLLSNETDGENINSISYEVVVSDCIEHIYGNIPESANPYKAIIATGYNTVVLDSPLTEQDRDNAQKLIGKLDENNNVIESTYEFSEAELEDCTDTDEDGLWDFEEVMFYLCGNPVIYFDEYGAIELPTVKDIIGDGNGRAATYFKNFPMPAYVKSGYDKAKKKYADCMEEFENYYILPISSDPINPDGDGDSIFDVYDCNKLEYDIIPNKFIKLINDKIMNHRSINIYEDIVYVYEGELSEDILKSFWSELSLNSSNNARLFYYIDVDGTEIYGLTNGNNSIESFVRAVIFKHIYYKIFNHDQGTFSFDIHFSGSAFNVNGSLTFSVVFDTYGNMALQVTPATGGSVSTVASSLVSVGTTITNAPDYRYLEGMSSSAGGSIAFGPGISQDYIVFRDSDTNELYYGLSTSAGVGLGADIHASANGTLPTLWHCNFFSTIDDKLSEYINNSILTTYT